MPFSLRAVKTRYDVKEVIARGGMGVVYKAYDKVTKRLVALKTLLDLTDNKAVELFQKECEDLVSLSHPNIVEIFDVGQFEDENGIRPYLVMPLLPGTTLDKLIRSSSSRLTVERSVDIFCQTCRGLQAAHERGLVHRDLKPSNIFVMDDDSVKIIDFGVAHRVDTTQTVGRKGTLIYMSPEQIASKTLTPMSDLFSLGVVCYETLTRRRPFERPDEDEIAEAILQTAPPPVHELNPAVSTALSQAIHKAMAKNPGHRYRSAKEFGEILQRALHNQPIEVFNPARIRPRLQRAREAFENGDFEYASEIIAELECEGHLDPAITQLRDDVERARVERRVSQLLEIARTRMDEQEYQIALQKIDELLQLDPNNTEALALKAKVDLRRTDQDIEGWYDIARTHLANGAFGPAREALRRILELRPREPKAAQLLSEVERTEQAYVRDRDQKEGLYRAAVEAERIGDVSSALSKLEQVLEIDKRAPEPSRTGTYQRLYDKVRSEYEAIKNARAEAKRLLDDQKFGAALTICNEHLAKYPGDTLFQALKYDVQEKQRQAVSSRIAETDRRVEAEPDLDRRVSILEDAARELPGEAHFERALQNARDKRDMVNAIVVRARGCEERGQLNEALAQWEILETIYPRYPGLSVEIERIKKRRDQARRQEAKARWVEQIEQQLEARDFARAAECARMALGEFQGDDELGELERLAQQGVERHAEAQRLLAAGQASCAAGEFDAGIDALRRAYDLDGNNGRIRNALIETVVEHGRRLMDTDASAAEALLNHALELEPKHALATGLLRLLADQRRVQTIDRALAQARRLQTEDDFRQAAHVIAEALALYPNEQRLLRVQSSLRKSIQDLRKRDLEQARRLAREVDSASDLDEQRRIQYADRLEQYMSEYGEDEEFRTVVHSARRRLETVCYPEQAGSQKQELVARAAVGGGSTYTVTNPQGVPGAPPASIESPARNPAWIDVAKALWSRVHRDFAEWLRTLNRKSVVIGLVAAGLVTVLFVGATHWFKTPKTQPRPPIAATEGAIEVTTVPPNAAILVNGVDVAHNSGALVLRRKAGSYEIDARLPGYQSLHQRVEVETGKTFPVTLTLTPENPTLRILGAGRVFIGSEQPAAIEDGQLSRQLTPDEYDVRIVNKSGQTSFHVTIERDGLPVISRLTAKDILPLIVVNFGQAARIYTANKPPAPVQLSGRAIGAVGVDGMELPPLDPNVYDVVIGAGKDAKKHQIEIGPSRTITAFLESDPEIGSLTVEANEDDATVGLFYNGKSVYQAVIKNHEAHLANVRARSYTVQISKDGYDSTPANATVDIAKGEQKKIAFELKRRAVAGTIRIQTEPDADVSLDDSTAVKAGPDGVVTLPNAAAGRHRLTVRLRGFQNHMETLVLGEGEAKDLTVRLKRALGTVEVVKSPPETTVTYKKSGESATFTAGANTIQLEPGSYVFTGKAPEYIDATKTIRVAPGDVSTVRLELSQRPKPRFASDSIDALFGKDVFAQPQARDWYMHKGDRFVGINRQGPGIIQFTAPLTEGRFMGKNKLVWATNYQDARNYVNYELDDAGLKVTRVKNGVRTPISNVRIARTASYIVRIEWRPSGISVRVNSETAPLITTQAAGDLQEGSFGFFGNREVRIADFHYEALQ